MAYPPALPPSTRQDSTLMAGAHAGDHNALVAAIADLIAELGSGPSGSYADLTSRLAVFAGTYAIKHAGEDAVITVAPRTGNDASDGRSWGAAKATLAGAIAALPATGGTILVASGTIVEHDVIIDRDNVTIRAVAPDAVLDASGTDKANGIIAIGRDNVTVEGLRLIGSGKGGQPTNIIDGTGPTLANLAIAGSGIILAGCSNSRVTGCTVEQFGGTTGAGDYNGVAGVWITWGCTDVTVDNNTVTACRNGINEDNYYAANPHGNKITANRVAACRFGIALDSESASTGSSVTTSVAYPVAYDTLVEGNSIRDCVHSGIDLNKARRARVANNYIEACGVTSGNSGIVVYGTASNYAIDVAIIGNTVVGCGQPGVGGHGIKLATFAYSVQIIGNLIAGNVGNGIFAQGAIRYALIQGNYVHENGQAGIYFDGTIANGNVGTNTIAGNDVRANGYSGILVAGLVAGIIANNIVRGNSTAASNAHDGIRLTSGSTRNSITGNIVGGGAQRFSIGFIDSTSTNNTVEGNDFGEPFNTGSAVGTDYATGRIGLAGGAEVQHWGNNGDRLKATSGAPSGAWPNGAMVHNTSDQRTYVKHGTGWRYMTTTAA